MDFGSVARALLRNSSADEQRLQFLARVSEVVLSHTTLDAVDLCLRDGDSYYCACAARRSGDSAEKSSAVAWCDGREPGCCEPAARGELRCVGPLVGAAVGARLEPVDFGDGTPGARLIRLGLGADSPGAVLLSSNDERSFAPSSEELYLTLVEVVAAAVALHATVRQSDARAAEGRVLCAISERVAESFAAPDLALQQIAETLPEACSGLTSVTARIIADGREYASMPGEPEGRRLSRPIRVGGRVRGSVELWFDGSGPLDDRCQAAAERILAATASQLALLLLNADLVEERSTHRLLRHSERLATIGSLVANLAHDLNDPLSTVSGFAELLRRDSSLSVQGRADLERIARASRHAQEIVQCLLLLARRSGSQCRSLSLNRVVEDAIELVEHRCIERKVRVERLLAEPLPRIHGDPVQLCQVVINLMRNAVQAMPQGGTLTLATRATDDAVVLAVEDTGVGMSREIRDRIFDPFFTTKDAADGTGLGLAIVQDIISLHGGDVDVESTRGAGTRLVVRLPLQRQATASDVAGRNGAR